MAMDHVMQHLVDLNRIWTNLRGSKTMAKKMKQWHENKKMHAHALAYQLSIRTQLLKVLKE